MDELRHRDTGSIALAVGATAAGSAICLATFFAVQGPFGTLNDIGNGAAAALSGVLAWQLRRALSGRSRTVGVPAALAGAGVAVVGSSLVVSGTTGFFLAGLVSSVGYAGIGAWLVLLSRSREARHGWSRTLRSLAAAAGALMAVGIAAAPGIALRLDDMATAPGWVWIGMLGWLGIFVVYPAWALSFGLGLTRGTGVGNAAVAGTAVD